MSERERSRQTDRHRDRLSETEGIQTETRDSARGGTQAYTGVCSKQNRITYVMGLQQF